MDAGTVDEDVDLLPLTASECHALVRESYQEIVRFTQSHAYVSSGQQVFGWRDRRQLVGDQVRFIITKTFNGRDAEELTSRAWRLTTTPQGVKELYSSTMNMAVRRMQVVDADNVVIYRTISNPTRTLLVKSLFLASRFRVGAGYILLYRSIDKTRLVTPKGALSDPFRKETWLDVFTWWVLLSERLVRLIHSSNLFCYACGTGTSSSTWVRKVRIAARAVEELCRAQQQRRLMCGCSRCCCSLFGGNRRSLALCSH